VEEAGTTGLSVMLVDDQDIVWAEGSGHADQENGVEAASRNRCRWWKCQTNKIPADQSDID